MVCLTKSQYHIYKKPIFLPVFFKWNHLLVLMNLSSKNENRTSKYNWIIETVDTIFNSVEIQVENILPLKVKKLDPTKDLYLNCSSNSGNFISIV